MEAEKKKELWLSIRRAIHMIIGAVDKYFGVTAEDKKRAAPREQ